MNSTSPPSSPLPLDSFGPFKPILLGILEVLETIFGISTTTLFNLGFLLAALATFGHYASGTLYRYAQRVCVSSIHLNDDDETYQQVMRWVADHHLPSHAFRSVKATMLKNAGWEEEDAARQLVGGSSGAESFDADRLISYRSVLGRAPIRLQPFEGWYLFRHRGAWVSFSHHVHKTPVLFQDPRERGYVQLEVLGRSLAPLEALLQDAQVYHMAKSMSTTNVFRAITAFGRGDMLRWTKVVTRPARDIRTVVLDRATKRDLLRDVNEYLHPRTRKWYANHGVPYRRGYLFSGAPGSGKTSLTAALAGVFGLDIYVLSLLDPALTESQLMRLFSEVPGRCIVLLEDVDVAGLGKRGEAAAPNPPTSPLPPGIDAALKTPMSASFAPGDKKPAGATNSGVSLSALLNAIDGVSSSEGRVLIMTTNAPDALDRALVRPGRVDRNVAFELPTRAEMEALFVSMYYNLDADLEEDGANPSRAGVEKAAARDAGSSKGLSDLEFSPSEALRNMAQRFAEAIPERTLSLASIQGFLLRFKSDPEGACERVSEWNRETLRELEDEKRHEHEAES